MDNYLFPFLGVKQVAGKTGIGVRCSAELSCPAENGMGGRFRPEYTGYRLGYIDDANSHKELSAIRYLQRYTNKEKRYT
jgi:hypothetical protein